MERALTGIFWSLVSLVFLLTILEVLRRRWQWDPVTRLAMVFDPPASALIPSVPTTTLVG